MGKRKRLMAQAIKEAKKDKAQASLRNIPSSPRKMRYVADLVRGMEVGKALATLRYNSKTAARDAEKLLLSAINVWEQKNERKADDGSLYIAAIYVDEAPTLKRMRPAPQGRGHRIRKRSNHLTIRVDAIPQTQEETTDQN